MPSIPYLVDASYWIYLMHLPLTFFVPALFRHWNINGTLKMLVMMVLVTIPLIITYHLLVRSTAVGTSLEWTALPGLAVQFRPEDESRSDGMTAVIRGSWRGRRSR